MKVRPAMRKYLCEYIDNNDNTVSWSGSWELTSAGADHEELKICGRGSCYHVVLGYCSYGNYLCIPDMDIGCGLSSLTDTFWNYKKLSGLVGEADAVTISRGLNDFASN